MNDERENMTSTLMEKYRCKKRYWENRLTEDGSGPEHEKFLRICRERIKAYEDRIAELERKP